MTLNWWGKLLGGTFGFIIAGPAGALLGTLFGHNFDKSLGRLWGVGWKPADREGERFQDVFFTATFRVMGHLAKIDGRVSAQEIAVAQAVMQHLRLTPAQKRVAVDLFQEGKQANFKLDAVLDDFRRQSHERFSPIYQFIEIQLNAIYADGMPTVSKRDALLHICDRLDFPRWQFEAMDAIMRSRYRFHDHSRGSRQDGKRESNSGPRPSSVDSLSLEGAYTTLGLERKASDEEVKMAYRRLINRYHPDKLAAKG
jgi:DnaJ like chaperone protein